MFDNSNSSLGDISREWNEKADATLKASMVELSRDQNRDQAYKTKRTATHDAELRSAKMASDVRNLARDLEEKQSTRINWTKTQIGDINDQTKLEIESLDALRHQKQEMYQAQLSDKNQAWEKAVLERRAEAAQLRSMISHLTSAISVARDEAKADIDEAKRRASESAKVIKGTRERQIQQIADLTNQIQKENSAFELEVQHVNSQTANVVQHKKDELERLQGNLAQIKRKLKEKEVGNEQKFRQQFREIRELRSQLEYAREIENQRQNELMSIRKSCATVSRKISAWKNSAASLKCQLAMTDKDNEELQSEIVKLEAQMFPSVFKTARP